MRIIIPTLFVNLIIDRWKSICAALSSVIEYSNMKFCYSTTDIDIISY